MSAVTGSPISVAIAIEGLMIAEYAASAAMDCTCSDPLDRGSIDWETRVLLDGSNGSLGHTAQLHDALNHQIAVVSETSLQTPEQIVQGDEQRPSNIPTRVACLQA
jgi:hypothetical protein